MEEKDDMIQGSASIFEEIEVQLDTLLTEKKKKIQEDLEDRIEKEKEEAEIKLTELEKEVTEERDSLQSYQLTLKEYEDDKRKLKNKIREHLNKAMEYQPQIESLTAKTFDELKKVMDLNKQLEEINAEASSRVNAMKLKLEEKYGITPPVEQRADEDEVQFNLDGELEKLKKIKELLGQNSYEINDNDDGHSATPPVISPVAETENDELAAEEESGQADDVRSDDAVETASEDEIEVAAEEEQPSEPEEFVSENQSEEVVEDKQTVESEEPEVKAEPEKVDAEPAPAEEDSAETQALIENLEQFRKTVEAEKNIELSYFENGKTKLLDGQELVDIIKTSITEATGLFEQLTESDSPKEQFFSKQEILWHQETLREYIQEALKMCQQEQFSFPESLEKALDSTVLKALQTRLSQENWSNTTYFSSFKEYAEELKAAFLDKSTPRQDYLQSLMDELKKG